MPPPENLQKSDEKNVRRKLLEEYDVVSGNLLHSIPETTSI